MDVFAHIAAGALLGRAVRPSGDHWVAFAIFGAAAGFSPDIDAPLALMGPEVWAEWHQVVTHSVVGLLWVPVALSAWPFQFAPWQERLKVALMGWCLHVVLDLCARWPVPILWPFSKARFAWTLIQHDFSWTIDMILIVGLALTLWDPIKQRARALASFTATLVVSWLLLGFPT